MEIVKGVGFDEATLASMEYGVSMSEIIWVMIFDEELACIFGIIPPTILSDKAYLWFYNTDALIGHEFTLARYSQSVIDQILEEHSCVVGHVVMGAGKSMKWLKWLGAKFGYPQGTGVPFMITRQDRGVHRYG